MQAPVLNLWDIATTHIFLTKEKSSNTDSPNMDRSSINSASMIINKSMIMQIYVEFSGYCGRLKAGRARITPSSPDGVVYSV